MSRFALTTPIEAGTIDQAEVNAAFDAFDVAVDKAGAGVGLDAENIPVAAIPPQALTRGYGLYVLSVNLDYEVVDVGTTNSTGMGTLAATRTIFVGVVPQESVLVGWSAAVTVAPGSAVTAPTLSLRAGANEVANEVLAGGVVMSDATLVNTLARGTVLTIRVTMNAGGEFTRGRAYVILQARGW